MRPRRHKKDRNQNTIKSHLIPIVLTLLEVYPSGPIETRELENRLGYGVVGKKRIAPHIQDLNDSGLVLIASEQRSDGYDGYVLYQIVGIDTEEILNRPNSQEIILRLIHGGE